MSDHLLRLAELVAHLTCDMYPSGDARIARAAELVRDLEAAPFPKVDEAETRRAADLLISHFGGQSLLDAVEKAVALRYMKREQGIIPPWEMMPPAPERRTITREEAEAAANRLVDRLASIGLSLNMAVARGIVRDMVPTLRLTVEG